MHAVCSLLTLSAVVSDTTVDCSRYSTIQYSTYQESLLGIGSGSHSLSKRRWQSYASHQAFNATRRIPEVLTYSTGYVVVVRVM
jgi:hypothetical protein